MQKEVLIEKLNKVLEKLKNLQPPQIADIENANSEDLAKGVIARDFGIDEWDWPQGVGLYGINKLQKLNILENNNEFFYSWFKKNIERGLPTKNVNTTTPLLTLIDLCDVYKDKEFEELCLEWAEWLMKDLPKTKENGFQHVTSALHGRDGLTLNEGQLWIDTLFMMALYLNKMGVKYKKEEWIAESIYQVLIHIKYLYEKKNGLFYHGWTFIENNNFGEIFWCRGNSWFTLGLMEFIESSEKYIEKGTKEFMLATYRAQVEKLTELQDVSGGWHTVLDDKDSYLETSGTASIVAGIFKGIQSGVLDKKYEEVALKGLNFILENIAEDGTVLNVSGGTGIGMNKEHYKNIIIAPMAYGQSLTIVALAEALKYITK
ncbi:glycoside hydrolase family 88/105 protein [Fusobacterium mortiferum]|uniref:glycoside hydrolase family 88/105 protein n=1 Tax=Fusobacterium mortiferum TaxID=850 RepID=UPI0022E73C9F|nr:glycoside hydrolase family 88 protein [Fusobacterium mortiferum]